MGFLRVLGGVCVGKEKGFWVGDYPLKDGNKNAKIEAARYKYATIKKKIWRFLLNLSFRAKVNANRVKDTPNNVAPFINA
jgi:hypothetical protein